MAGSTERATPLAQRAQVVDVRLGPATCRSTGIAPDRHVTPAMDDAYRVGP
jgi:hypothetical protein